MFTVSELKVVGALFWHKSFTAPSPEAQNENMNVVMRVIYGSEPTFYMLWES